MSDIRSQIYRLPTEVRAKDERVTALDPVEIVRKLNVLAVLDAVRGGCEDRLCKQLNLVRGLGIPVLKGYVIAGSILRTRKF